MRPGLLRGRLVPLLRTTGGSSFFRWNLFGNIGPLVFALLTVPFIYAQSSREYVGFLTLIWAAIGYAGLFDFGLSRALFFFAAKSRTDAAVDLAGALGKAAGFALAVSLVLNVAVFVGHDRIGQLLKLANGDQLRALGVLVLSLPVYLLSNMIRSSLEGLESFKEANIFKFVSYASLFLCPAALIAWGNTRLADVCLAYAAARVLAGLYAWSALRPHLAARRAATVGAVPIPFRTILGFGGWATVSSTISPLMVYGDRFALAFYNGTGAMAVYALLQEFIGKTILFSASYVTSVQPRLGYLPRTDAELLYRQEHRNIILLSVLAYAGCLLLSPVFAAAWLDVSIGEVALLAVLMSVGFMFNSMAQMPLTFLLARGHPDRIAVAHAVEAVLYFPLMIVAAKHYGVPGAAVVGVGRQILDYGILTWQARRKTA